MAADPQTPPALPAADEHARGTTERWPRRAWVTARAAALFLLPLPLVLALVGALIGGDVPRALFSAGGLACLCGAGALSAGALVAEARYFSGERPDPPAIPLKLLSALLTAIGIVLAALAGGHTVPAALVFAILGVAGHVALYGRDVKPPRIAVSVVDGIDGAAILLQLKQAYGRLRGIEASARAIPAPEFRDRLLRITGIGRDILGEIERDPVQASRARRFLNVYLDGAERVTSEYARTHGRMRAQPLEEHFRKLLTDMEHTFADQHRTLVERDLMSLDVDMEVLDTRLTREGPG